MNNTQNLNPNKPIPCPECDTALLVPNDLKLGQIMECPSCGIENEVVCLSPLKLSPLEEEK